MLCSLNWLKEYVAYSGAPKAAATALTMSGAEVEAVHESGVAMANVVTAEVLTVVKHPNADKLSVCDVKADGPPFSIVCGAKNMKPGDKVALALPGALLPGGFKIKKSRIRGVESEGMMCSEVELGIAKSSDGIMILPPDTPIGLNLADVLGSDTVFELNVTPNRADLLSIKGVARELGAVTGAQFKEKDILVKEDGGPVEEKASVTIADGAPCARYCARVITGVKIAPSPDDVRKRLEAAGIRSINNVVDVTNYVMLEAGQPLHAFDLSKLANAKIHVRLAVDGETIETIDGKVSPLDASMLVIADDARPVALAGVMGGKDTEVTDSTSVILLEAAWFEPSSVRKTSKKTGLSSESSYRFERMVDIEGVRLALDMAAEMIARLAGGKVAKGAIEVSGKRQEPVQIQFRQKKVDFLLGMAIPGQTCLDIFRRIGVTVEAAEDGVYRVIPPSFRSDLKSETDLIEEIARIYGYDKIPAALPSARLARPATGRLRPLRDTVGEVLTGAGFFEVANYSFVSRRLFEITEGEGAKGVELLNPLSDEQAVMRASLLPSLLENLCYNLQRKTEDVRIYELAPVFNPPSLQNGGRVGIAPDADNALPMETWKISGLMHGPRYAQGWDVSKDWTDFYDCKGVVERLFDGFGCAPVMRPMPTGSRLAALLHPGKSAVVMLGNKVAGHIGELHPDAKARFDIDNKRPVYLFELDAATIVAARALARYSSVSRFPESTRDIAFIIADSLPYENIVEEIRAIDAKLIESVSVFDVYYGSSIPAGSRSMALRIIYRSSERTLTSAEVDTLHARVTQELVDKFKAVVRG